MLGLLICIFEFVEVFVVVFIIFWVVLLRDLLFEFWIFVLYFIGCVDVFVVLINVVFIEILKRIKRLKIVLSVFC